MKKNNLMSGALILSIGAILSKLFSSIYRIGLTRILGGEGIGLYQLVFPLYSLCIVLATAGVPMAISKVVAKNKNKGSTILNKCLLFSTIISLILTALLLILARPLAMLQGQKELMICYMVLAPTIIFVSFTSVLRGYFQGYENFTPSAVSNIVEQFVKLALGLVLSLVLLNISVLASIIGAMLSIGISEVVSLAVLYIYLKKLSNEKESEEASLDLKSVTHDMLPIILNNVILPIATFIDSLIVVNLLSNNFSPEISVFLYGLETGAVNSLVTIPTIFSFAIASVILPGISAKMSKFNRNGKLSLSIKIILIITVPCVLCFIFIPDRLLELLYGNNLNGHGVDGINVASRLLSISGLGIVFLAINQVYSSALQGIDERYVAIKNLTIGVVAKFVFELIFMPSILVNIYALSIGNTICYVVAMVLNHIEIREKFNLKLNFIFAGKLILSNALMTLSLAILFAFGGGAGRTLLNLVIVALIYLISLIYFKIFEKKDFAEIKFRLK